MNVKNEGKYISFYSILSGSSTRGELISAFEKADTSAAYPYAQRISLPCWKFVSKLPTAAQDGAITLKGSHRMRTGGFFYKNSAPLSLAKAFRMNLILAGSISLDITFICKKKIQSHC
jgi:hypothetical protein